MAVIEQMTFPTAFYWLQAMFKIVAILFMPQYGKQPEIFVVDKWQLGHG